MKMNLDMIHILLIVLLVVNLVFVIKVYNKENRCKCGNGCNCNN